MKRCGECELYQSITTGIASSVAVWDFSSGLCKAVNSSRLFVNITETVKFSDRCKLEEWHEKYEAMKEEALVNKISNKDW